MVISTTQEIREGLSASLEDYLEVIFHLEQSNRVARAKDIADQMNVQRASVTGALKSLAGRGLVNYSPYSYITLTPAGRNIARDVIQRHEVLKDFFIIALQAFFMVVCKTYRCFIILNSGVETYCERLI